MPKFNMNWVYLIVIAALAFFYLTNGSSEIQKQKEASTGQASYSEFKNFVNNGYAERIVANKSTETLKMYVKPDSIQAVFHLHRTYFFAAHINHLFDATLQIDIPICIHCSTIASTEITIIEIRGESLRSFVPVTACHMLAFHTDLSFFAQWQWFTIWREYLDVSIEIIRKYEGM